MNVDRYAEIYPYSSPYAYCLGNPLKFTDINGDTLNVVNSRGDYLLVCSVRGIPFGMWRS